MLSLPDPYRGLFDDIGCRKHYIGLQQYAKIYKKKKKATPIFMGVKKQIPEQDYHPHECRPLFETNKFQRFA